MTESEMIDATVSPDSQKLSYKHRHPTIPYQAQVDQTREVERKVLLNQESHEEVPSQLFLNEAEWSHETLLSIRHK